jgi:PPOX class probable F420-dependent enzyme, Rv0121 family
MRLELDDARRCFAGAQVARLATLTPDGRPHLVPIVFALEGDRIYSIVDTKPKASMSLARLRHIEANPHVSLLVDAYRDDWERLWWVRADGRAMVVADGPDRAQAITLLRAKYPQYLDADLKFGSATIIDVEHWVGWTAGR